MDRFVVIAGRIAEEIYPKSLADVNRAVRPLGVRFYRSPAGYYYPDSLDGTWTGDGVYVYNCRDMTIEQWKKEAEEQMKKHGE